MKKNISINISGIIFHIEEDGYEILRKYLDSVNRYFASFEDSTEILADIEGRIAEIFLARLNEGKQVITVEDVQSLMATMGSVSDFKAAEEQETPSGEFKQESRKQSAPTDESRKLYRDNKRKILGGVCAGLGHYFNLDPVWPRLLLALLTLGTSGIFLIIYVILWIVLPGTDLEETSVKKMYRDPDKRVLGGVASGVAAFFDADLALIRVLFVIFGIFGFGIVIYIVMWIVLPEAKTITEKMKMQGEPVTLSNIESSVRKSMNEKEPTEESILTRIILLPFRAIGAILRLLGPLLRTIVDVLRVAIGIVISLIGLFLILGFLLAFGVLLGTLSPPNWHLFSDYGIFSPGIPFNAIRNSFPTWLALVAFFTVLIPSLFAVLVGSSIIARRVVFSATVGWSLFVIFFISAGILTVSLPQLIFGFKEKGEYKTEQVVDVGSKTPVLQILETGMDDYDVTTIYLRGHDAKNILLVKRFESQGPSRKVASENAQMVDYQVTQSDSILTFDSNITFKDDARFRAQRLDVDVLIPYGQAFVVDGSLWRLIGTNELFGVAHHNGTQTLRITTDGWECLTCQQDDSDSQRTVRDEFGLTDFHAVDLQGIFNVRIERGDRYAVEVRGPERERKKYDVYVNGNTLVVDYKERNKSFWKKDLLDDKEMRIRITMPELRELDVTGAGKLTVKGFDEEDVSIKLTGAVTAYGDLKADRLSVKITGVSVLDLRGSGRFLEADILGASGLRAFGYEVARCEVSAHGASSAKVNVSETLEIDKGIASSVSHRGNAEVINR
ncbi:MAG: PspC domain-containing protein [Cytophagales bacterium]|nr:PspC domain-containing protein [Cytophagales bacterium]